MPRDLLRNILELSRTNLIYINATDMHNFVNLIAVWYKGSECNGNINVNFTS